MNPITKIKEISFQRLNTAEYTQFLSNVQTLTDIAKQSKISDETAELNALDKKIDEEAVYLLTAIKNERKTPIEARKTAAVSLYNITKPYIGLQKLPNRQETQAIEGLIIDLEKPENMENITKLGLSEVLSALKAANLRYKELTAERAGNQVAMVLESAKEVRQRTDKQYDEIATIAFVSSVANPTEETQNFISQLNS